MARRRPEPTANPARGAALVVVAVLIGLFLLRNGLDTSEAITSTGGSDSSSDGSDTDGSDATDEGTDGTTTTTVAVRPPAEVATIVLNDSSIAGAAGNYSDVLAAAGYPLTNPDGANADTPGDAAVTVVYFAEGFEAEAKAVAAVLGLPDLEPTAMPTPAPGPIASAVVVVAIGTDLGSVTPTTAAT